MRQGDTYLACELCWLVHCSEELFRLVPLDVSHFSEIKKADCWAAPDNPVTVVLRSVSNCLFHLSLQNDRCVRKRCLKPLLCSNFTQPCTNSPDYFHKPKPTQQTYLFACDRVPHQCKIHQLLKPRQRIQICELRNPVLREN